LDKHKSNLTSSQESLSTLEGQMERLEKQLNQITDAVNTGRVGNYNQAVIQQNQLKDSISALEDRILEQLELLEIIPCEIDKIDERVEQLNERLQEKIQVKEEEAPVYQSEAEAILQDMKKYVSRLPEREQRRFKAVRSKHTVLAVPLTANSCGKCHVGLPLETVSLIMRGNNIYRCSNCGVFIVDSATLLERD
jgi:predicted  nucleic acid-binding Zn-ribbon protein